MEAYDRHTPYNQLPPLPPDQALYMDAEVGAKLVLASRRLAELKGLAATLPNQTIFVNTIAANPHRRLVRPFFWIRGKMQKNIPKT